MTGAFTEMYVNILSLAPANMSLFGTGVPKPVSGEIWRQRFVQRKDAHVKMQHGVEWCV